MRIKKSILKKINNWKKDPMLVTGLYRLFTYIPWKDVPKNYKQFFEKDAKKIWDDDLGTYKYSDIKNDMIIQIKGILRSLTSRNFVQTIGIIPMLLADMYMLGNSVDYLVKRVKTLSDEYIEYIDLDRESAENYATLEIADILKEVVKVNRLELDFEIDVIVNRILTHFEKFSKKNVLDIGKEATEAEYTAENLEFNPFVEDTKGEDKKDE